MARINGGGGIGTAGVVGGGPAPGAQLVRAPNPPPGQPPKVPGPGGGYLFPGPAGPPTLTGPVPAIIPGGADDVIS